MTTFSAKTLRLHQSKEIAPPRAGVGIIVLGVIVVAAAGISRLSYLSRPFDGDGAMFAYMGKLVTDGGRFGEDLIDNKFPTVGLITSVFWRAFGDWWPGYVIGQLVLALVASIALSRQSAKSFGQHAFAPMLLVSLTLLNLNSLVTAGFQLETLQAFFNAFAAMCALSALRSRDGRDAMACGLCAGCALLVKPTGGGVLAGFVIAVLFLVAAQKRGAAANFRLLISAALGVAFPLLVAALYLIESDQLRLIPRIAEQVSGYARSSSFAAADLLRPFIVVALFGSALLIRGWVYRRRAITGERTAHWPKKYGFDKLTAGRASAMWVFASAWLVIEFAGVLMQRRMYAYHFLPLACPAALVFAAIPRQNSFGQLAGVLALPLILSICGARDVIDDSRRRTDPAPAVAAWLAEHTLPGERVWRDITPQVLVRTDLQSASRMQLTFLFMNTDDSPAKFSRMLIDDLREHRARFVVIPSDVQQHIEHQTRYVFELSRIPKRAANFKKAWREIDAFVRGYYAAVTTIGNETIWERKQP